MRTASIVATAVLSIWTMSGCGQPDRGSVIFIHPDGASSATWAAARALHVGPDGDLNWDKLPAVAVYRGHMANRLTATSNGGGTVHAYGVKVFADAYGMTGGEEPKPIVDQEGHSLSVAHQAMRAGLPVGLVQSGTVTEPGTGCFVASVPSRSMHDEIAAQLIESGTAVILGGGEQFFLPAGVKGVHGPGKRQDDRNLIEEAKKLGYTVVRTREELLALEADIDKVLGLFAANHTFNARAEEELAAMGLPMFEPDAPTVAEMTEVALRVLDAKNKRFLLVVEEEGTDNFGNRCNAVGMLEAMKRADDAVGVVRKYRAGNPQSLVFMAADSDAGGMRLLGLPDSPALMNKPLFKELAGSGPVDGRGGTATPPFIAAPDRTGKRMAFAIVWATHHDVTGGVLVRGEGINSDRIRGSFDNTKVAELIRLTLFGNAKGPN
jgi:alkaline phosphatase